MALSITIDVSEAVAALERLEKQVASTFATMAAGPDITGIDKLAVSIERIKPVDPAVEKSLDSLAQKVATLTKAGDLGKVSDQLSTLSKISSGSVGKVVSDLQSIAPASTTAVGGLMRILNTLNDMAKASVAFGLANLKWLIPGGIGIGIAAIGTALAVARDGAKQLADSFSKSFGSETQGAISRLNQLLDSPQMHKLAQAAGELAGILAGALVDALRVVVVATANLFEVVGKVVGAFTSFNDAVSKQGAAMAGFGSNAEKAAVSAMKLGDASARVAATASGAASGLQGSAQAAAQAAKQYSDAAFEAQKLAGKLAQLGAASKMTPIGGGTTSFGDDAYSGGTSAGVGDFMEVGSYAGGGFVGSPPSMARVHSSVFNGAPSFADGGIPIIAHPGEAVVPLAGGAIPVTGGGGSVNPVMLKLAQDNVAAIRAVNQSVNVGSQFTVNVGVLLQNNFDRQHNVLLALKDYDMQCAGRLLQIVDNTSSMLSKLDAIGKSSAAAAAAAFSAISMASSGGGSASGPGSAAGGGYATILGQPTQLLTGGPGGRGGGFQNLPKDYYATDPMGRATGSGRPNAWMYGGGEIDIGGFTGSSKLPGEGDSAHLWDAWNDFYTNHWTDDNNIAHYEGVFDPQPTYATGTLNTGNFAGPGVDGMGGFNAILHPNEAVLPFPVTPPDIFQRMDEFLSKQGKPSGSGALSNAAVSQIADAIKGAPGASPAQGGKGVTVNVHNAIVVHAKDVDSFKASENQLLQEFSAKMKRALKTIGDSTGFDDPTIRVE